MIIISSDSKRIVDIGGSDIWFSIYSTAKKKIGKLPRISNAIAFLETGHCEGEMALECAREFNLIRDEFSKIPPNKIVYDINDLSLSAPWCDNISPIVTSCANLFITADGKDLLFEIVSILTYAFYTSTSVDLKRD